MATDIATDTETLRRAWLATACALGGHLDFCVPCALTITPDCDDGQRLRAATDAAWDAYEGSRP